MTKRKTQRQKRKLLGQEKVVKLMMTTMRTKLLMLRGVQFPTAQKRDPNRMNSRRKQKMNSQQQMMRRQRMKLTMKWRQGMKTRMQQAERPLLLAAAAHLARLNPIRSSSKLARPLL
jgi:hypothetical protein